MLFLALDFFDDLLALGLVLIDGDAISDLPEFMFAVHRVRLAESHIGIFLRKMLEPIDGDTLADNVGVPFSLPLRLIIEPAVFQQAHENFIAGPGGDHPWETRPINGEHQFFLGCQLPPVAAPVVFGWALVGYFYFKMGIGFEIAIHGDLRSSIFYLSLFGLLRGRSSPSDCIRAMRHSSSSVR